MCQDDARFEAVALADEQDARRMQGRRRQAERLMALAALLPTATGCS